ncbi:MAG: hypothetical protein ABW278_14310 [Steroidobacteraceae bacterium]
MKWALPALLLAKLAAAAGLQASDARGLQLDWDRSPQSMEVDGLPINVQRAAGPGVAKLVERIARRWRDSGSQTRQLADGGWQLLARWDGTNSEVMQWRGAGAQSELLLSSFNARIGPARALPAPAQLPANCLWGRQISGMAAHRYLQRTARCRGSVAQLLPQLRSSLTAARWQITAGSASVLHVARGAVAATLVLMNGTTPSEAWLVWISADGEAK